MKSGTTSILLLLTILLLGLIYFWERELPSTDELRQRDGKILPFPIEKLNRIHWKSGSEQNAVTRDADGNWLFDEPRGERADPAWVDSLKKEINALKLIQKVPASELIKPNNPQQSLENYQLGRRWNTLSLHGEGQKFRLEIGKAGPLQNSSYLSKISYLPREQSNIEEQEVLLCSGSPLPLMQKELSSIRDPSLLRLPEEQINSFTLQSNSQKSELKRAIRLQRKSPEENWQLTEPNKLRCRDEALKIPLQTLRETSIEEFLFDRDERIPSHPTRKPLFILSLESLSNKYPKLSYRVWKGKSQGGDESESALLQVSDRPGLIRTSPQILQLAQLKSGQLRDNRLARIDPENLQFIEIKRSEKPNIKLKKTEQGWILGAGKNTNSSSWQRANPKKVAEFIELLNTQKVLSHLDSEALSIEKSAWKNPQLEIILSSSAEIDVATSKQNKDELSASTLTLQLAQAVKSSPSLLARYAESNSHFTLSSLFPSQLPINPLSWKSLSLLKFNPLSLRSIEWNDRVSPPLQASFDPNNGGWLLYRGNPNNSSSSSRNHTPPPLSADSQQLESLRELLSDFYVDHWVQAEERYLRALQSPSLVLKLTIAQASFKTSSKNKSRDFPITLHFAPVPPSKAKPNNSIEASLYCGQIGGMPQIFLLNAARYAELAKEPLL